MTYQRRVPLPRKSLLGPIQSAKANLILYCCVQQLDTLSTQFSVQLDTFSTVQRAVRYKVQFTVQFSSLHYAIHCAAQYIQYTVQRAAWYTVQLNMLHDTLYSSE